jgi:uncharacterized protein (TIGR03437 family)
VGVGGAPASASAAVVNAASNVPLLAPGTLATVYGINLAAGTSAAAPLPWPETLAGVQVLLSGRPAPLLYVSDGQVNFLVPEGLPVGLAELILTTPAGVSAPLPVRVVSLSPGIFGALHAGTADLASLRPARRGDYLEIYATGLGLTRDSGSGFRETVSNPVVHIGPLAADVTYSGLVPGLLGLYQVNVRIPANAASGLQPLTVTVDGVSSNPITVAVE